MNFFTEREMSEHRELLVRMRQILYMAREFERIRHLNDDFGYTPDGRVFKLKRETINCLESIVSGNILDVKHHIMNNHYDIYTHYRWLGVQLAVINNHVNLVVFLSIFINFNALSYVIAKYASPSLFNKLIKIPYMRGLADYPYEQFFETEEEAELVVKQIKGHPLRNWNNRYPVSVSNVYHNLMHEYYLAIDKQNRIKNSRLSPLDSNLLVESSLANVNIDLMDYIEKTYEPEHYMIKDENIQTNKDLLRVNYERIKENNNIRNYYELYMEDET